MCSVDISDEPIRQILKKLPISIVICSKKKVHLHVFHYALLKEVLHIKRGLSIGPMDIPASNEFWDGVIFYEDVCLFEVIKRYPNNSV